MNRAVEQDLTRLVPSLNALPLPLVDLAVSLLAQSRSKAPQLKPDEEIARSYACAHLACER
jgi:origin recognition complex subunit 6